MKVSAASGQWIIPELTRHSLRQKQTAVELYQKHHTALGGAARGANGGVLIGAIAGDAGKGAAIGAGVGAVGGGLDLQSWVVSGAIGYDVIQSEYGLLSIVGGVRYLGLDVDVKLDCFDATALAKSGSDHLWDGIVGIRGFIRLTDSWYLPYYADIGTGDSDLTYQLFAGVGYRYSWGDIRFGYKYLHYDFSDDYTMEDLALSGPALGVGFKF